MYVLRSLSSAEMMIVFVEDGKASTRKQREQQRLQQGKVAAAGGEGDEEDEQDGHARWTVCTLGVAPLANPLATPFDAFLQRVLIGGNQQPVNSSNPPQWSPRSTAVSLEGFIFHIAGDWEIKVGSVMVKGGSAGSTSRGVLIEVRPSFGISPRCS